MKVFDTTLDSGRTSLKQILESNPLFDGADEANLHDAEVGDTVEIDGGTAGVASFTRVT